jgi:hypothetical protein
MTTATENPAIAKRSVTCARCGVKFECGLSGQCWCAAEPYRLAMPGASQEDCLCPACLRQAAAANSPPR